MKRIAIIETCDDCPHIDEDSENEWCSILERALCRKNPWDIPNDCPLEPATEKVDMTVAVSASDTWKGYPAHPNHYRKEKGLALIDCQDPCENPKCVHKTKDRTIDLLTGGCPGCVLGGLWEPTKERVVQEAIFLDALVSVEECLFGLPNIPTLTWAEFCIELAKEPGWETATIVKGEAK